MVTNIKNFLRETWNQLFDPTIVFLPLRTADEQTRLSWAKHIESYDAVPAIYKDFFEPFLAEERQFPYTILTPSYEEFIHKTTEKLVCDFGHEIYILERIGNTFKTKCYPLEGISYVEVRTVLLDSHIKITGVTRHGISDSSTIKLNTVTTYLFTPIIERIRRGTTDYKGPAQRSELAKFDPWIGLNFKFMNFARQSILLGEKVIHSILQPEIRERLFTILGKTYYRILSRAVASILTDRELIIIQDAGRVYKENNYGGIWNYIPLNKIGTLSLSEKNSDLLVLSIHLPDSVRLEYIFQASAKGELDQLLYQFKELTKVCHI